jgi:SAM-dependent methyltransferase
VTNSLFDDPRYAACYDAFFPWDERDDFQFYLPLILKARSVLDIGCLVGLDPAEGMLTRARRRTDIEWVRGDLRSVSYAGEFDLVVMTGHAFQELTADEDLSAALATVAAALTGGGAFAFETRNPAVRGWERWESEYALSTPDPEGSGGMVRMTIRPETPVTGEIVYATTRLTGPAWPGLRTSRSALRFLDADQVAARLAEAGLTVTERYGDFDRSPLTDGSPEIVTIARR